MSNYLQQYCCDNTLYQNCTSSISTLSSTGKLLPVRGIDVFKTASSQMKTSQPSIIIIEMGIPEEVIESEN